MSRRVLFGCVLGLAIVTPVQAQAQPPVVRPDTAPEKLLSPKTQLYIRWDGVTAHKDAYQASVWGPIMAGPTGDSIRTLLAKGPKLLAAELLADPLLNGQPPAELRAIQTDIKNTEKIIDLLADKGIILGAEIREPPTGVTRIGKLFTDLLGGRLDVGEAAGVVPKGQAMLIVPNVGKDAAILFSGMRLLTRSEGERVKPLPANLGRTGFQFKPQGNDSVEIGWWAEGPHFVLYVGTLPVDEVIKGIAANVEAGGVTAHPLYQRCLKTGEFESVARGYLDTANLVDLAKRLGGPFIPGLNQRLDDVGLGNLKAVVFSSGFKGKESRALWEFDLPGERKGLAKVLKRKPLSLSELPPMPPDVSRFAALRIDPEAAYDAGLSVAEAITHFQGKSFGVEDDAKTPAEAIKLRKEYLERELYKMTGVNVREDLVPHLGDKFVLYQSPNEGLSAFGSVLCISVKDADKVRAAVDRLQRALGPTIGAGPSKIRKKVLRGVEIREIYARDLPFFTPTYAVTGEWLVIAVQPQPVQGFVLRQKGELDTWRPDAETSTRLAKMPAEPIGIQFCRPQSTVQNLCVIGPLFLGTISQIGRFRDGENDFEPLDVGLIPNAHELSKHLFPNLTLTYDDGKTIRIEVNESFSLPLEFAGFEALAFAIALGTIN